MPMPMPGPSEDKEQFVDRCMGDETMNEDVSDPAQRRAVCETQWDERGEHAMKYGHIVPAVFGSPWAILPETYVTICEIVRLRASGGRLTEADIAQRLAAAAPRTTARSGPQSIGVLPLYGVLAHRMNMMTAMSGGTSLELAGRALGELVASPQISAIVLDIDSPGGEVNGVTEMAAQVRRARAIKPVVAVANSMAASAAYWIAASASEVVVTPSGQVGSIGVVAAHEDVSAAQERDGVKTTLITAGRFKAEGSPFAPLGDEARADVQARVDEMYGLFVADVAKGRDVPLADVRAGFGEGRLVTAARAVKLGMADRIATLDETLSRLAGKRGQGRDDMAARAALLGIRG